MWQDMKQAKPQVYQASPSHVSDWSGEAWEWSQLTSANGVLSGSAALGAMNPPSFSLPLSGTYCLFSVSSRPGMIQISFLPEENSCSCLLLFSEGGFFCLRRFSNFLFRSTAFLSALSHASFSSSSCLLAYLIRKKKLCCSLVPRCSLIWSTWEQS